MPIYVYKCDKCEQVVEEIQKLDDPPPTEYECEQGGQCAMHKQMTAAGFKFIGEGWGGWNDTGDGQTIARQIKGKQSTKYGEGVG